MKPNYTYRDEWKWKVLIVNRISKIAEWSQPVLAMSAGLLIASNLGTMWVIVAMWLFLTKDIGMIIFASINSHRGLIIGAIGSGCLNIFGIIRWTFY